MFVPLRIKRIEIDALAKKYGHMPLPKAKEASQQFYKAILNSVTDRNGVIDGANLQGMVFPFDSDNYDVFISYSHNDEIPALYLATFLRNNGLSVFIDSTIWNSADDLLKAIDHKYCMAADNVHFDYIKRNFSTSHVHAMLSMAMLEAIRRSECCLFIESSHSLTLKSGIEDKTLSPWIFEEATFISSIQPSLPPRLIGPQTRMFCEGGNIRIKDSAIQLKAQYNIDLSIFKEVKYEDFEGGGGTAILDVIYDKYHIKKPNVMWD